MLSDKYLVSTIDGYEKLSLFEIHEVAKNEYDGILWSARLATGIFGLTNCESGKRGSKKGAKGMNEIIFALGDQGLEELIELGFIPCPTCKPENTPDFWKKARATVMDGYYIKRLKDFADKSKVGFDARRVFYEYLLPKIGKAPSKIYLPQGLSQNELLDFKARFEKIGFELPPVGCYDKDAPGGLRQYKIE